MRYRPTYDEFAALAATHTVVPVYRQLIGDALTPVSAFQKLQAGDWAFLFESVVGGERIGRYSFLGAGPFRTFEAYGTRVRMRDGDGPWVESESADPLQVLEDAIAAYRAPHVPGLPRFCGGAVGYAGYDTIRYVERLPNAPYDDRHIPDLSFGFYDRMVIFDHINKTVLVVAHACQESGIRSQETGNRNQKTGVRGQESEDRSQETGVRRQEPEDRNQKTGVRGQESEDRNQKTGVRGQESEDRSQETGVRRQEPEDRNQKTGVRGQESEDRSQETGVRRQEPEDRNQKTGVRGQESEDRSQETGVRRQEPEDRNQKTGVRGQESEDRSQETGVRRQEPEDRNQKTGVRGQESEDRSQETGVRKQEPGIGKPESEGRKDSIEDLRKNYEDACRRVDELVSRLQSGPADLPLTDIDPAGSILRHSPSQRALSDRYRSNFTAESYQAAVRKTIEYINAGDVFQVVLSQRFQTETLANPFDIYRALRVVNPSPFMFYVRAGAVTLVGASPEIMCRMENGEMVVRPLAGTRRRGATEEEDKALAEELVNDPKERAEHIMLVDLARNDIGRVAERGSVRISDLLTVERYSHVMHLSSTVTGRLERGKSSFDALRSSLPAGTLSGAPKIRAMEIIDELEPHRRGPYGGAIGYIDFSGNMDTCIALRTMVLLGQTAYIQAGAGLVADSDPASEYQETVNKAMSLMRALDVAETQIQPAVGRPS